MFSCICFCRYAEYIAVKDLTQLVKIPDSLDMDVAAMLPCGGLMAYSAVERAKPFVTEKLQQSPNGSFKMTSSYIHLTTDLYSP